MTRGLGLGALGAGYVGHTYDRIRRGAKGVVQVQGS
jgi:hypothetical protein